MLFCQYLKFFSATLHEVNLFISYHFSNRYFLFLINGKDTLTNDMPSISGYKIIQYTNYILPRIIILPINISPMLLFFFYCIKISILHKVGPRKFLAAGPESFSSVFSHFFLRFRFGVIIFYHGHQQRYNHQEGKSRTF